MSFHQPTRSRCNVWIICRQSSFLVFNTSNAVKLLSHISLDRLERLQRKAARICLHLPLTHAKNTPTFCIASNGQHYFHPLMLNIYSSHILCSTIMPHHIYSRCILLAACNPRIIYVALVFGTCQFRGLIAVSRLP